MLIECQKRSRALREKEKGSSKRGKETNAFGTVKKLDEKETWIGNVELAKDAMKLFGEQRIVQHFSVHQIVIVVDRRSVSISHKNKTEKKREEKRPQTQRRRKDKR